MAEPFAFVFSALFGSEIFFIVFPELFRIIFVFFIALLMFLMWLAAVSISLLPHVVTSEHNSLKYSICEKSVISGMLAQG